MPQLSPNESFELGLLSHQVGLLRLSRREERVAAALIARLYRETLGKLLDQLRDGTATFTVAHLNRVLEELARAANPDGPLAQWIVRQQRELGFLEERFQAELTRRATQISEERLALVRLSADQVAAAAEGALFGGGEVFFRNKRAVDWLSSLTTSRQRRLRAELAKSLIGQETVEQAALRVRKLLETTRRESITIARSGLLAASNNVRERFYEANPTLFEAVRWVSTLDTRTSDMCIARDGELYTVVDHEPIGHDYEWGAGPGALHFSCRSTSVGVLRDLPHLGLFVNRPTERAALGGTFRGDADYEEWLRQQVAEAQEIVLGETRARLFQSGVELDRLLQAGTGEFLTLSELAATDAGILRLLEQFRPAMFETATGAELS